MSSDYTIDLIQHSLFMVDKEWDSFGAHLFDKISQGHRDSVVSP